ncbi:OmpA family protein [Tropicimonas sp. S265A]|uniref:OmpA family protein n=1 Tax=Tropicimonas sp. S265A TaxID=3415134 RepID=UPI003C7AE9B6
MARRLVLTVLAFGAAAAGSLVASTVLTDILEERSVAAVGAALDEAGATEFTFAEADGLRMTISGTAPDEAARFAAISAASRAIAPDRIIDALEVAAAEPMAPPQFSLELLRNEDGISLIGLVPAETERDALVARLSDLGSIVDMVETADHAIPTRWIAALEFGLEAAELLPKAKISLSAGKVHVAAIAESTDDRDRLETRLRRTAPAGVVVTLDIAAPRPVLAPYTLRFSKDGNGARFEGCAAETARDRGRILAAAEQAGLAPGNQCTLALGAPSPRWADAATAGIRAVVSLGGGTLTITDADVTLIAPEATPEATFARVTADLEGTVPEPFSVFAVLPEQEEERPGIFDPESLRFTATLSPEGLAQLRGHVTDTARQEVTETMARALFGGANVYNATSVSDNAPEGWSVRVLAALEGLGHLHNGAATVTPGFVEVSGRTGSEDGPAEIAQLLADRLGATEDIRLEVRYDPLLDPKTAIPTEEACFERIELVKDGRKITFDPGSARLAADTYGLIEDIAEVLAECTHVPMEIAGHTDSQGREVMNLDLSQQRADAVLAALSAQRLTTANLVARGYGEALPIADNDTAEGREANRRIEFTRPTPPVNRGADRAEAPETSGEGDE